MLGIWRAPIDGMVSTPYFVDEVKKKIQRIILFVNKQIKIRTQASSN